MAIRLSGLASGLDTDAIIKELMTVQTSKKTAVEHKKTKLEWKKEKWEELNTKIYGLYTENLSKLRLQGSYLTKKVSSSNESKVTATATTAAAGTYQVKVNSVASSQYITGKDMSEKGWTSTTKLIDMGINSGTSFTVRNGDNFSETGTVTVDNETTLGDFLSQLSSNGMNANFDEKQGRFFISGKESGADNKFTLTSDTGVMETLGLVNITEQIATDGYNADGVTVSIANDSILELNGAVLSSTTTQVSAGGLTLDITGTTSGDETISIAVSSDSQAVYDSVKETITKYNELLDEMTTAYNAPSAKDYHMLEEDERKDMSEEQIELWENKIKDSLLRRDDTLKSLTSAMRSALQEAVEVDGKSYTLSSFGIVTGTYTEYGKLHIYGDKEDGTMYAEETDRLKSGIEDDPDTVGKVLSGIFGKLYNTMTEKMKVSKVSSALTFYNDVAINDQVTEYESQIKDWERRLEDMEDRYYKQYSAMETSMAKLQSQQNSLANLFGSN